MRRHFTNLLLKRKRCDTMTKNEKNPNLCKNLEIQHRKIKHKKRNLVLTTFGCKLKVEGCMHKRNSNCLGATVLYLPDKAEKYALKARRTHEKFIK